MTFDDVALRGREMIAGDRWESLVLVDVVGRWVDGYGPRRPLRRADRPAVTRNVPALPGGYYGRPELERTLREAQVNAEQGGGVVVLHGHQGMGKSLLAQRAAALTRGGAWFLNASDRTALLRSYAVAENAERNRLLSDAATVDDLTGDALNARARLRRPGPWTVVVDNCNVPPGEVADLLPIPSDRQLLIVTTINETWTAWANDRSTAAPAREAIEVGPLAAAESRLLGCPEALLELAGGRPLFVRAFAACLDTTVEKVQQETAPAGVDPAAWVLWALAEPLLDRRTRTAACTCAWLQPDAIPGDTIAAVTRATPEDVDDVIDMLVARGLATRIGQTVRIHRLVTAAIRSATSDAEALTVLASEPFLRDGHDRADNETLDQALDRLHGIESGVGDMLAVARALSAVMTLLEPRNQVERASDLGQQLEALLAPTYDSGRLDPSDVSLLAEALFLQARWRNQNLRATYEDRQEGRQLAQRSQRLWHEVGDPLGVAKCQAVDALLMQRSVRPDTSRYERTKELTVALDMLIASLDMRREHAGEKHPATARATFNLGGVRLELAKVAELDLVEEHLVAAHAAYATALRTRKKLYGLDVHIHYAASLHGFALVAYYRAVLGDRSPADRVALLHEATTHVLSGLDIRQALDTGIDGSDVQKSLVLLAKITDARIALSRITEAHVRAGRKGVPADDAAARRDAVRDMGAAWAERAREFEHAKFLDGVPVPR